MLPNLLSLLCALVCMIFVARSELSEGRIIQVLEDEIGADNFTFYRLQRPGMMVLQLVTLSGDVDIYTSSSAQHPDYNLYDLKSATCGLDTITVPSSMPRPVYVSLFGHPNHIVSRYRLTIVQKPEPVVEDYEHLVSKYERYYFEEMEREMTGFPSTPRRPEPSTHRESSVEEEFDEENAPLWWKILVAVLQFGIEVVL